MVNAEIDFGLVERSLFDQSSDDGLPPYPPLPVNGEKGRSLAPNRSLIVRERCADRARRSSTTLSEVAHAGVPPVITGHARRDQAQRPAPVLALPIGARSY